MTTQIFEAIFEKGVFRPLTPISAAILEGQQVRIVVETEETVQPALALALQVYEGLSEKEISDIEKIILERDDFFKEKATN